MKLKIWILEVAFSSSLAVGSSRDLICSRFPVCGLGWQVKVCLGAWWPQGTGAVWLPVSQMPWVLPGSWPQLLRGECCKLCWRCSCPRAAPLRWDRWGAASSPGAGEPRGNDGPGCAVQASWHLVLLQRRAVPCSPASRSLLSRDLLKYRFLDSWVRVFAGWCENVRC